MTSFSVEPQKADHLPSPHASKGWNKKRVIGLGALVVLAAAVMTYLFVGGRSGQGLKQSSGHLQSIIKGPTPTPFLFEELTIPYLRARTYTSALGPLQRVSENQEYTAYLTSYDSDALRINGLLTVPKGNIPGTNSDSMQGGPVPRSPAQRDEVGWPAIIFVHGYIPPASYQTLTQYSAYVDYLAQAGYVVFKIDLRGHGDSEGEPSGAYYSSDYIIDVLNAYAALEGSDFVNPKKIGLWGHSMAGNVVTRSMAAKPDIPAVVVWAGAVYSYSDRLKYGINDGSYMPPPGDSERQRKRKLLLDTYGEYSEESAFWRQVPATSYVQDLQGAIQINHAVDDNVVDIGYSRDFMKLLDATNVPHELKEYSSGGHNISGAAFNQAMLNTVGFFKKYL